MRRLSAFLLLAVAAAACGSGSTTDSTFARIPTAIAFDWVNAVAASDTEAIEVAVDQSALVVVAAAENAYTLEETAALLQEGLSPEVSDLYWEVFRDEFASFSGTSFRDLEVGVYEEFSTKGTDFAQVTLRGEFANGTVVTVQTPTGWQVDMAATVGPALVTQIRDFAEQLDDSPEARLVERALLERVVPGLYAAAYLDPDNPKLNAELARIERALSQSSDDL